MASDQARPPTRSRASNTVTSTPGARQIGGAGEAGEARADDRDAHGQAARSGAGCRARAARRSARRSSPRPCAGCRRRPRARARSGRRGRGGCGRRARRPCRPRRSPSGSRSASGSSTTVMPGLGGQQRARLVGADRLARAHPDRLGVRVHDRHAHAGRAHAQVGQLEDLARLVDELELLVGVAVVARERARERQHVERDLVRVDRRPAAARPRAPPRDCVAQRRRPPSGPCRRPTGRSRR